MPRLRAVLLIFVFCASLFQTVHAQTDDTITYTTEANDIQVTYPDDWEVLSQTLGSVFIGKDGTLLLGVMTELSVENYVEDPTAVQTPGDMLEIFRLQTENQLSFISSVSDTLNNGVKVIRAEFSFIMDESGGMTTVVLVVPSEDTYFLVSLTDGEAEGSISPQNERILYAVAESVVEPEGGIIEIEVDNTNRMLDDYIEGDLTQRRNAVAELADLGLIPEDYEVLLTEELLVSSLNPTGYADESTPDDYQDFAVGALISLRPLDEDTVVCALVSRLSTEDRYLAVAFTSFNSIGIISQDNEDDVLVEEVPLEVDVSTPQHLLYIVQADELSIFVNGERVVDHMELNSDFQDEVDESLTVGYNLGEGCVMTSYWGIGLPRE